jgi:2-hydroxy-4-carboxymuconate semialdehyde hemiacetal dehydrogenase
MNICMVGHGMMGTGHTEALRGVPCTLHTIVGRRPEPTQAFAERYGYLHWTTDLSAAIENPQIDVVIVTNPSDRHAQTALAALAAGKHTLVEIPLAMNMPDAERIVGLAKGERLNLGVVHPLRMRTEMVDLQRRSHAGQEHIRHIQGRFFIRRLENVGVTGYRRSWTDNLLWHHLAHLCDFGLWMLGGSVRCSYSRLSSADDNTGIPMDACVIVETDADQTLVCTGSYYGREPLNEVLVVTDDDSYRWDIQASTLTTGDSMHSVAHEMVDNAQIARDFIESVNMGREPAVSGESVLPVMRLLQHVQDQWDAQHGRHSIPGRTLSLLG